MKDADRKAAEHALAKEADDEPPMLRAGGRWKPAVIDTGGPWDPGSLRREDLYGDDGR